MRRFFHNKNLKLAILIIFLFISFLFLTLHSYAKSVSTDLSNNFFRLHILANSDSQEDQDLKLKVRDNIIEYMNTLTYSNISKESAIKLTKEHLNDFQKIAEDTIRSEGYNYPVKIEIGNFYFPTKNYGNISLPAGYYDALKIEIGSGNGKNWWCSLFPPLCFVDISSGIIDENDVKELEENLSSDEFAIITEDSETIKLKFKIVELLAK